MRTAIGMAACNLSIGLLRASAMAIAAVAGSLQLLAEGVGEVARVRWGAVQSDAAVTLHAAPGGADRKMN